MEAIGDGLDLERLRDTDIYVLPLKAEGFTCMYLGMKKGIEYKLATQAGLPFRPVTSGRLHRNLNPDTLLLPFRVIKGTVENCILFRGCRVEKGAEVKNGLEMLLLQAFASWEFWNGKEK